MSRISVIIPVYNAEKYIEDCVKSVLEQSFQDFEMILVDDGSQDASGMICDGYAEKYEKVKVIHTQNQGPAAARKQGVELAIGEYITFVDADDWLDSDMLAFMYQRMGENCADIVCLGHKEMNAQGNVLVCMPEGVGNIEMTTVYAMMQNLHGTRVIDSGPWAKLIRRDLFDNIDYCIDVTIGEDYFMILQLLEKAQKVVLYDNPLYNRCIRSSSISRSGYSMRHKMAFERYMQWRNYLLENYPDLEDEIIGYHTEYEMAVLTAMCRNQQYDKAVIKELQADLKKNYKVTLKCRKTPFYMRVSAVMIAFCCPLFIVIFRVIHVLTGR